MIWDDKARDDDLSQHLHQPKRLNKHRTQAKSSGLGKTPNRVGIERRLDEAYVRRLIDHWVGGTVIQGHKQSGLVTLVGYRNYYLLAARQPKISAELTQAAMTRL